MGYHLILRKSDGSIDHRYAQMLEDMCEFPDITPDAIIYQGEEHWKPAVAETVQEYNNYTFDWYRAGIKAQRIFKHQAMAERLIIEPISQDPAHFETYQNATSKRVKRGDFLIRNAGIEIEVKCLKKYGDKYYLRWADLKAHENMEHLTHTPVVFAIYERDGDSPKTDTLCMIPVAKVFAENRKAVTYDPESKCALIPTALTTPGFTYLLASKQPPR